MGVFKRDTPSLLAGAVHHIDPPAGKSVLKSIYHTSTNLTFATIQAARDVLSLIVSVNTNYAEGYYPINVPANGGIDYIPQGALAPDVVTIVTEWV